VIRSDDAESDADTGDDADALAQEDEAPAAERAEVAGRGLERG
jgi:hypothetical protein